MPKKSFLKFTNYSVDEIKYKAIPLDMRDGVIQLHPQYERRLIETGNGCYDLFMSVGIYSHNENKIPFELYAAIIGHFEVRGSDVPDDQTKDILLRVNTSSILFPFLRSLVTTITANANMPPVVLPTINFTEFDKK